VSHCQCSIFIHSLIHSFISHWHYVILALACVPQSCIAYSPFAPLVFVVKLKELSTNTDRFWLMQAVERPWPGSCAVRCWSFVVNFASASVDSLFYLTTISCHFFSAQLQVLYLHSLLSHLVTCVVE